MMRKCGLWLVAAVLTSWNGWGAELRFGPYLQDVRDDRATVMWTTRGGAGVGAVRYSTGANSSEIKSISTELPVSQTHLSEVMYLHRAELRGLSPGAEYNYAVTIDGKEAAVSRPRHFRTAGGKTTRFLVMGDSGDGGADQRFVAGRLEQEEADFLLHTGDIAYFEGTFRQFEDTFFAIYANLLPRMPVFPTPGNHDIPGGAAAFRTLFAPNREGVPPDSQGLYYSFDWGDIHFAVLDSNDSLANALAGTGGMIAWLEGDLQRTQQKWRVVAIHHAPFVTTDNKRDDPICKLVREQLTPIFERYAVHLVLSGHEHVYQRTQGRRDGRFDAAAPGTVYVTTGGGGSQYYEPGQADFVAASAGVPHFLRVTAQNSEMRVEAVTRDGRVIDSWSISAGPWLGEPAVSDAASFGSSVAPGGLVSRFGWNLARSEGKADAFPLQADMNGTSVQLSGRSAPLLYTGRTQINAVLPFAASGASDVQVRTRDGSAGTSIQVMPSAPAIFTVTAGGEAIAAAIHSDGRLVTSSAAATAGEWISLFVTGLGRVRGNIGDGVAAPLSPLFETDVPVRVLLAGNLVESSAAVLAPGYAGLYQINIRVPSGLTTGARGLQLLQGTVTSPLVALPVR